MKNEKIDSFIEFLTRMKNTDITTIYFNNVVDYKTVLDRFSSELIKNIEDCNQYLLLKKLIEMEDSDLFSKFAGSELFPNTKKESSNQ